MHDLVDALIQENLRPGRPADDPPFALAGEGLESGEQWCHIDLVPAWVCFRVHPAVLQPYRLSRAPVWYGEADEVRQLAPDELLALVLPDDESQPGMSGVADDLRSAVAHASVTCVSRGSLPALTPRPGSLREGELLGATRGRPFHPTARAASGWSAQELVRYGPMSAQPVELDWVAVRRDRLRWGSGEGSSNLQHFLLDAAEREQLDEAMRRTGLDEQEFQPLPVHPWHGAHVLFDEYALEHRNREVVSVAQGIGRCRPTSSLRTMATEPETRFHLKLPLGVSTLGATRLLPPRYLDNGQRAQRTMNELIGRDPVLARRVLVCDESLWAGWQDPSGADEFADRPGHLAAQVRVYPDGLLTDPDRIVLPMAALASHEWDVVAPICHDGSADGAVEFFRALAEAFCEMGLSFLRYGVLPELHGQNVLVTLRDGVVERFVLRDHDTLRLYPDWLAAEGVADPGYRITPGAPQSLSLSSPQALLGYLQTLGFQVNLFGIADALARHHGVAEAVFWHQLRAAVTDVLARLALPDHVAHLVADEVLRSSSWPSRLVLGPMLRGAKGSGVSMPAGAGLVPNPLSSERLHVAGRVS